MQLILASQSPRRALLLREAGYAFEQVKPPYDDPPQPVADARFDPLSLAAELACRKAMSAFEHFETHWPANISLPTDMVIIGADTICVGTDGTLIGQPTDVDHARDMIRSFTNATHDVVSGVTLIQLSATQTATESDTNNNAGNHPSPQANIELQNVIRFADDVAVTIGEIDDATLDAYLATNQWQGKAGGYNLFDRQAAGWPITLPADADPTTVVGLPMRKLRDMLSQRGITVIA